MFRKLTQSVMALALIAGMVATSAEQAEARGGRGFAVGVAAGLIGLGILGAAAARDRHYHRGGYGPECYPGPRRCRWENQRCFENRYGEYVCRGGDYVCGRAMICD